MNIKHIKKIKPNPRKLLSGLLFIVIPACVCYLTEFYTHNPFETMNVPVQFLNILFFELFAFLGLFLFKKGRIALWFETILFAIIGLANYFILKFRSAPIMPWDIFSIKTAASVADNYSYALDTQAITVLLIFAGVFVLSCFCDISVTSVKLRLSGVLLSCCLLAGYAGYVQSDSALYTFRLYDKLFTPTTMSYKNGTITAFCMQLQYLFVEKPEGYSVQTAEELLDGYSANNDALMENSYASDSSTDKISFENNGDNEDSSGNTQTSEMPNIIVIMNEAFSDLDILGDFTTNEDYIPFVHSLLEGQENTQSGYLNVSVLGGNTANSEFEFLTGQTMAFLPQGSIPYQQYIKRDTFSLASYLKELGYSTIAMHPYKATGWQRHEVYPMLGFDEFLAIEDFKGGKQIRKYVSDEADYNKIISTYESKEEGTPLFLFNVTMQNHSSYTESFDNFTPDIMVEGSDSEALSNYLSLLKISDTETKELIEYFSRESEKTLIVFFGDHQPTDSVVSDIWKLNGKSGSNLSLEDQQLRYQVPFFVWANYDIEEATGLESSLNYFAISVLEAAGLPLSDFHQFLKEQRQNYPVITPLQCKDSSGTSFETKECKDALNNYAILQYYHLLEN